MRKLIPAELHFGYARSLMPFRIAFAFVMLALLPEAQRGALAQPPKSEPPVATSNTEVLIVDAHRYLNNLRGDHENVHDAAGNRNAVISAQNVLHDAAAPMLARLDRVPEIELKRLSSVWQMLYFETKSALEFYLACASQTNNGRLDKATASVADANRAVELLDQIAAQNDPADAWLLEDQKREKVRWFQAAAEGIAFEATQRQQFKNAALAFWNDIDGDYRQRYPATPASHLAKVVPGAVAGPEDRSSEWPRIVGVGFALLAALFFMVLILISISGKNVSEQARPILVFFFALCCAMASAFIAGSLDLRGQIPFFGDSPVMVGATGGLAVLILVIFIGNRSWKPSVEHNRIAEQVPTLTSGLQSSDTTKLKEE